MARRRYGKSPAISQAGHSAQPRDPAGDESLAQPIGPRSEYGKPPPEPTAEPEQHFQTSLGEQMRAQRAYAEQQQIAQLHGHIDQVPGLSAAQRQWLHGHPAAFYRFDLLHAAHQMAQAHGIVPDSEDYFRVLESALHHYGHLPPQQMAQPAPAQPPPVTHVDVEKVESPAGEPESAHMDAHFVSAPVSRSDSGHSIEPELSASTIKLSPAQREIANLPGGPGEVEYAKQLLKMQKAKKSGLIKD